MSDELIRCVGGPLDGHLRAMPTTGWLNIPDRREWMRYVAEDGYIGTTFGVHVYESRLSMTAAGAEFRRWEWVRYTAPDGTTHDDWAAVVKRLERIEAAQLGAEYVR